VPIDRVVRREHGAGAHVTNPMIAPADDTHPSPDRATIDRDVRVHHLLGVRVGEYDIPRLNERIAVATARGERIVIANHNLHSLYLWGRDAKLRDFHAAAEVTHVDGMSLIFLGCLVGVPLQRRHRVTYVDWIGPLMREAARRRWRVFSVGGQPGVFERAAERLRADHPGLILQGAHGYFDQKPGSRESAAMVARIAAFRPHVLLVGMGMPRQEHWVHDHRSVLSANAILMAGAAMDYVAGVVPTPPRGAAGVGFEWLWRLAAEPGRLWRRYLIEPWYVLGMVVGDWTGRRPRSDR
jgi:N-acetylglucosaminyldiphosphoundecaprenol N-acetyl-beta-D-mannosaminyltransferase